MLRPHPAAGPALALLILLGGAVELRGQTPARPEIESLRFEGNAAFSNQALGEAILTRHTRCRSLVLQPFCWAGRDFAMDRAFLNPRWLRDDYIRLHLFYRQRGYGEVQVDTVVRRPTETTARITFQIREGTPHRVSLLEFRGLEELDDPDLTRDLPIRVGDPLDRIVLEETRETLTRRLRNEGYAHADVLRNLQIPAEGYDAEVEFDIYTGPRARFGPIEVTGAVEVEESVVRRMLPFQEGSFYSQELLFDAQRNLFNLEIFRRAQVVPDLDHHPDSVIPLRVQVTEGRTHRVRSGGGWSSADCFGVESRWSSRNFFGGARRLVVRGRLSNILASTFADDLCRGAGQDEYGDLNWVVSADFTQPFLLSPRNSFSASLFVEHQSLQEVFVRDAMGLNLGVTRTLGRTTPLTLSYRPQRARLSAAETFFCISFLVCDPDDVRLLQRTNLLAPAGLSLAMDLTDRSLSPSDGYRLLADVEHASRLTGSDFGHERVVSELAVFREPVPEVVLATRVRGGWMRPRVFRGLVDLDGEDGVDPRVAHPQKRFFAGGSNSVRGYAQNQLGPRVLSVPFGRLEGPCISGITDPTVDDLKGCDVSQVFEDDPGAFTARPTGGSVVVEGSVELRFPVWGRGLGGAAFVDFGQVWPAVGDMDVGELRFTPGFGARYDTPVGPIRVDIGYQRPRIQNLQVLTDVPDVDLEGARQGELVLLNDRVAFGDEESFFRRLQLHLSIGHAF